MIHPKCYLKNKIINKGGSRQFCRLSPYFERKENDEETIDFDC